MDEERQMILRMLKEGKITVEEADALLQTLDEERSAGEGEIPGAPQAPEEPEMPERPRIQLELGKIIQDIAETIPREVLKGIRMSTAGRGRSRFFDLVEGLHGMVERQAEAKDEMAMAAGQTLELYNRWGDILLSRSTDAQMRFTASMRAWGATAEDAERTLAGVNVQARRVGETIVIDVPRMEGRRLRVDVKLMVPEGVQVVIEEARGDVRSNGLRAGLRVLVASGDIQITDHAGPVELDIKSGDLTMRQVEGDVSIELKSGDVDLSMVRGAVRGRVISGDVHVTQAGAVTLDVINGDVDLADVPGEVSVETKSGDIDIRVAAGMGRVRARAISGDITAAVASPEPGEIMIETVSGDIELKLSPQARTSIEATVRSGEIDCALPLEDRTSEKHLLRGLLNGGGGKVRLHAVSGDITIGEARA